MRILEMIAGSRGMGDARSMGEMLRRMGRRGDTMLAHITPEEADMLMQAGGAGTINPDTGLPEFAPRRSSDFDDAGDFVRNTQSDVLSAIQRQPVTGTPRGEAVPMDFDFQTRNLNQDTMPATEYGFGSPATYEYQTPVEQMAVNQYRGSAFPYPAATGETDVTGERMTAQAMNEFPYGMSARNNLTPQRITPDFQPLQDQTVTAEPGLAQRAETGLQELQDLLNRYPNLTRAGTAGAGILAQALMFNQANKAMRRDIESTRAAAEPFRQAQQEAMSRATGEGLTPEQQQELEIAQARAREGLGARGTPTGSAAAGILAGQARRARSLARQESFAEALRLANIADQYDRRALEMELARDQQLAQLFAGILGREVQQAQRTQAPVTQPTR